MRFLKLEDTGMDQIFPTLYAISGRTPLPSKKAQKKPSNTKLIHYKKS
jgi:hypothetical protein